MNDITGMLDLGSLLFYRVVTPAFMVLVTWRLGRIEKDFREFKKFVIDHLVKEH